MRLRGLALAFACAFAFPQQPAQVAVIGFLEDHSGPEDGIGGPALRVAFMRQGDDWVPAMGNPQDPASLNQCHVPGISAPQTWQLLDQGKPLGTAKTQGWSRLELYSANGLLSVKRAIPFRGKVSGLYGGWSGGDRHQPMLATLGAPKAAATTWHPALVNGSDLQSAWPLFKKAVPTIPRCDQRGDLIQPEPPTSMEDVEATKAYSDGDGQRLVCLSLREGRIGPCEGPQDRPVSDFWFFMGREGKTQPLRMPDGDDALTLTPLAFVSLNGHPAALFYCSGYDRDGYILYYGGFRKSAEFFWSYH